MTQFKISGKFRREKKKELAGLKFSLKSFWHSEDIDRAMGGGLDDVTCLKIISDLENKISKLENNLKEPSTSVIREDKLNQLGL
jgi:hypothetical protein